VYCGIFAGKSWVERSGQIAKRKPLSLNLRDKGLNDLCGTTLVLTETVSTRQCGNEHYPAQPTLSVRGSEVIKMGSGLLPRTFRQLSDSGYRIFVSSSQPEI